MIIYRGRGMFLYKVEGSKILKNAFNVHNTLGYGFLEKVYQNALIIELEERGLSVNPEVDIEVNYKGRIVGKYKPDLIVKNNIILEIKTEKFINKVHIAQVLNYLKVTDTKVGYLLNFGIEKVEYKRLIF